jgi:hypothetical protein
MRRSVALVLLVVLATAVLPVPPAHASDIPLPAPALITPVDEVASTSDLELRWLRVTGAVGYHVQAFRDTAGGYQLLDEYTVNDRWFGSLPQVGGTVWWQVTPVDGQGASGTTGHATFTAASVAPETLWPPDGTTIRHPAETPVLAWRSAYAYDGAKADQDLGSPDPPATWMLPIPPIAPGDYRWQPAPDPASYSERPMPPAGELRTFTYSWPDSAPVLLEPAADAHVAPATSVRLRWAPVAGASGYGWEVRNEAGVVVANATSISAIEATWGDVAAVIGPGTYTWHVRARLPRTDWPNEVFGAWSADRTLIVDPWQPATPTAPHNAALLDTWPLLRWTPVPGATGYQVQITDDPGVWDGMLASTPVAAFAFHAYDGTPYLTYASPGRSTRFWRVRAAIPGQYSSYGDWSAWTGFVVRQTGGIGAVTDAPQVSPADCPDTSCPDLEGLPILRWAEVPGAVVYRVFLAWDGDPTQMMATVDTAGTAMALTRLGGTETSRTSWAVVACPSTAGCPTTMPESVFRFRVVVPVPVVHGPADGSTIEGPAAEISWDPPAALPEDVLAVHTTYAVRAPSTMNGVESPIQPVYMGASTISTLEGVNDGMTVTWQVRAETADRQSEWSTPRAFTRMEPRLVITGPDPGVPQSPTPLLDWDAPASTVFAYYVEVTLAADEALYGPGYFRWRFPASGTSVRPSFPLPAGEYRWRVQRGYAQYHSPQEGNGPWTEGAFTVAGATELALLSPAPGATVAANAIVLDWSDMAEAMEMELQTPGYVVILGPDPDLPWETSYHWYTDVARHAVTTLQPDGPLYWRVCWSLACSQIGSLSTGVSEVRAMRILGIALADTVDPVVTARPRLALTTGTRVTTTRGRVDASWTADDIGTGVDRFEVRLYRDGARWSDQATEVPAASLLVAPGHRWEVRVRAVDMAGNTSAWSASRAFSVGFRQDTSSAIRLKGTWHARRATHFWGGSTQSSRSARATATTTFTGRGIAWIGALGPSRGTAKVYVDGSLVATVSLARSSLATHRIVWQRTWASSGTHTVRVKVTGLPTSAPRVDIDGFVVLR